VEIQMARTARKSPAPVTHILHVVDFSTGETSERRLSCSDVHAAEAFEEETAEGRGEVYLYAADPTVHDLVGNLICSSPY
jgi:hypothetical protein